MCIRDRHNAEAGDAADGRVTRHEEKIDRSRNDGHRHGQNQHFFGDILAAQLFVHGLGSSQSLFDPSVRSRQQVIAPSSSPRTPARPSSPRGAHRQAPKNAVRFQARIFFIVSCQNALVTLKRCVSSKNSAPSPRRPIRPSPAKPAETQKTPHMTDSAIQRCLAVEGVFYFRLIRRLVYQTSLLNRP